AHERGLSLLEVAIGALLARRPVSSVIAGATKPDQVRANATAGQWTPSEDDLAQLSSMPQASH
ncbi:MAG: aldo/keto reductase, partial [Acidimicrobiales bacterium]